TITGARSLGHDRGIARLLNSAIVQSSRRVRCSTFIFDCTPTRKGSMGRSISKTSATNPSSMSAAPTKQSSRSPTRAPRWWPLAGAAMLSIAAVVVASALTSAAAQQACGDAQSCQKACGAGDQIGCVQLGKLLQDGKGVAKDPARAHQLFVAACQKENAKGCSE